MYEAASEWSPKQALLKGNIMRSDTYPGAKALLFEMHAQLHTADVYGSDGPTFLDEVWSDVNDLVFRSMPTPEDATFAWDVWHITRIEDLVVNILIDNGKQVLDEEWLNRLGTDVKDTGNAMTDPEIIALSNELNQQALFDYRRAVGVQTKRVLEGLYFQDMSRKVTKPRLSRILQEGGVLEHPESIWLLDFWGKKTVAGLILMPITRHQLVHLNDCIKLKRKCRRLTKKAIPIPQNVE